MQYILDKYSGNAPVQFVGDLNIRLPSCKKLNKNWLKTVISINILFYIHTKIIKLYLYISRNLDKYLTHTF